MELGLFERKPVFGLVDGDLLGPYEYHVGWEDKTPEVSRLSHVLAEIGICDIKSTADDEIAQVRDEITFDAPVTVETLDESVGAFLDIALVLDSVDFGNHASHQVQGGGQLRCTLDIGVGITQDLAQE